MVWQTKGVKCLDFEGTSDVYTRAFIDPEQEQRTDTHYRCQNGEAHFNWRLVFPLTLPLEDNKSALTVQLWDK